MIFNQNPYIEGHTTQWPKRKRTNNHLQHTTQKTKDRATRTPLKTGREFRYFGRVSSCCSSSGISHSKRHPFKTTFKSHILPTWFIACKFILGMQLDNKWLFSLLVCKQTHFLKVKYMVLSFYSKWLASLIHYLICVVYAKLQHLY